MAVAVSVLRVAYRQQELRVSLETVTALIAVFVVTLVSLRFKRQLRLDEALLTSGLGVLAGSNLIFVALPALGSASPSSASVWGVIIGGAFGSMLMACAPFAPQLRLDRIGVREWLASLSVLPLLAATALFAFLINEQPLRLLNTPSSSTSIAWPAPDTHPAALALLLASACLFSVSAFGFARRTATSNDELYSWVALASLLAAFWRLDWFLHPSLYSNQQWIYTGDGLRLGFYALLLVGAMRETASFWHSKAETAVIEERRRLARELHDGVAQEIAFITRNLQSLDLAEGEQAAQLGRLKCAAERARAESRRVLAALSTQPAPFVEIALAQAACEVGTQLGAEIELDIASVVELSPLQVEALVWIAREAVANAARHSGAKRIGLGLDRSGDQVRMRVTDHGHGFELGPDCSSFGLASMHERARSIGGRLRIESSPGHGTSIEVTV
jgi:signal transduction histidine kinase